MARIQILELPEGLDDDRPPFMLIIDQVDEAETATLATDLSRQALAQDVGARTVAVFRQTIDIPDNYLPAAEGGATVGKVHVKVVPDLTDFRAQVEEAAHDAQQRLTTARDQADG